jgi:hypothetical protein
VIRSDRANANWLITDKRRNLTCQIAATRVCLRRFLSEKRGIERLWIAASNDEGGGNAWRQVESEVSRDVHQRQARKRLPALRYQVLRQMFMSGNGLHGRGNSPSGSDRFDFARRLGVNRPISPEAYAIPAQLSHIMLKKNPVSSSASAQPHAQRCSSKSSAG